MKIDLCGNCPAGHYPSCEKKRCITYKDLQKHRKEARSYEFNETYESPQGDAWKTFWRWVTVDARATRDYQTDLNYVLKVGIIWKR